MVKLNEVKIFPLFMIPTYLDFLIPQTSKMCDPVLVTLMKMQPHPAAHPHTARVLSTGRYLRDRSFPPPFPRFQKKKYQASPQKYCYLYST